jgi:hypothetical protein
MFKSFGVSLQVRLKKLKLIVHSCVMKKNFKIANQFKKNPIRWYILLDL